MSQLLKLTLVLFVSISCFSQNAPSTGLLFDDDAYDQVPMKARNVAFQDVVAEETVASIRQFVPEIRNQGGYGTCVGWSSAYYGRTILEARLSNIQDKEKITSLAFSPVFTYLHANVDNDYNCQGGAYIHKALDNMIELGTPLFTEYDVMCDDQIPDDVFELASRNRIKDYTRLFENNEDNEVKLETVKRSLINGNPVIIGFRVEDGFFSAQNVYEPSGESPSGGHAMCVVGYDDEKYGGAFEIVNSWGPDWGNSGFIWVRYNDFVNYTKYAYEMIPELRKKVLEKKVLSGELDLKLYDGTSMEVTKQDGNYSKSVLGWQDVVLDEEQQSIGDYATAAQYPENTRYRMYAKVNKPSYVYVVGADSDGRNGVLFPHKEDISPYIAYENTSVIVPGERYWFRLNSDVDSDYSVVIFSENKIDIGQVKEQLDQMEGELLDKLYVIFNEDLISKDNIILNENSMGFTAQYTSGSIALMILDIKRS